ncbi:MAG: SMC family ATPase [Cyanobacteria bacterium J06614_10]
MQILSVALTNFKTHKEQTFHFQPGTNAICGENGAGKTSILEAIAWVLFNYQGSYKKEDLIRNGTSSAQVRVAFISSRDSRTYEVQRSTTQGYAIFDPQLAERLPYTRTKDEVLPWLRQNLGVSPDTDLGQLFANTIGVPQGTFTADFLLSTEKRKPIFDTILKVEAYRETYRQSNSLRKYAEAQVQRLKDLVEQYEESLQGWDELQNRHQQLQDEIEKGQQQLTRLEAQGKTLSDRRQALSDTAEKLQQYKTQQQTLVNQLAAQQQTKQRLDASLAQAQQAADICTAQQAAYDAFRTAEASIEQLSDKQRQRQHILQQQQTCQQSLAQSQTQLSKLEAKLEQFETAEKELSAIAPKLTTQQQLETERTQLQQKSQSFANLRFQQKNLQQQQTAIATDITQTDQEIERLKTLAKACEQTPEWEQRQTRLQEQLSRIETAQQFEAELKVLTEAGKLRQDAYREQVVSAIAQLESWSAEFSTLSAEATTSIKNTLFEGGILSKDLLDSINSILTDLTEQTNKQRLLKEQKDLQAQIQKAYRQSAQAARLPAQQQKLKQLTDQQQHIQKQLSNLTEQLTAEESTRTELQQVESKLLALDNPRGKQQILAKNIAQKSTVQQQYKTLKSTRIAGLQQLDDITAQLASFSTLDSKLEVQQQQKQTHQAGYLLYLQNQQIAKQIEPLTADCSAAAAAIAATTTQKTELDKETATLSKQFDPEAFTLIEKQYADITSQADRLRGSLPQLQQRFTDLGTQLNQLQATAEKRDQAQAEIKKRERIKRFVNYARKVYKEAGPRITERYVHSISREADRLFRELIGRANVALTWSADYEITVQEGAHTRRFINLSGGEQMCAALAVRLALLKVLADIDVAFFDEPTTNMDQPRRASLAEAIARIKSFKQLFVISHDDTFEQVTETVITVERAS